MSQGLERVLTYAPVHAEEFLGDRRQSWDRLDDEALEDFEMFACYREMGKGTRSIKAVAVEFDFSPRTIQRVASRNSWLARVEPYDDECHRLALVSLEGDTIAMRQRHARMAAVLLDKAEQAANLADPRFMHPRDIPVWLDVAAKLERLSRGVTETKRVEVTGKDGGAIQVANELTSQDRRALLSAAAAELNKRLKASELENIIEGEVIDDDGDD